MKSGSGDAMSGSTGKIGNTGFYRRMVNAVEIIKRCPRKKTIKGQRNLPAQNRKFKAAVRCARQFLLDPAIREIYSKVATGFTSPAAMFVKDYMKLALISRVTVPGYRGRVGCRITIRVDNIVPVRSVKVKIESPGGEVIETGQAVLQRSGFTWRYITTRANPQYKGSQIIIESCDVSGHKVEWTRVL